MVDADKPVVAAFDFDGTLTRHDTLLPFLRHLFNDAKLAFDALTLMPALATYVTGVGDNGLAKERVFKRCLGGMPLDELLEAADGFALYVMPGLLRPETMRRFDWHRQQGHRCIVISASLELYVYPWAERAGFDDAIATRLEEAVDGRISGRLSGINCYGPEKLRRLEELLGAREGYTLYAYGDSEGDRELLSAADYAYYREIPMSETE